MNGGKLIIETEIETKKFDAQYKELEAKLNTMVKTLESDATIPVHLRMSSDERTKLEADIEKTKNKMAGLKNSIKDYGDEGTKSGEKTSKGMDKGLNSLRRFALSLFSVGSIYAMVSKASNAYLSQDTELAQKLQSVWVGLGSFIAPVLGMISDALLTGLGYLNEFMKALTGVDYIANANARAIEKQAKAQEKLNKNTFDFDEIRKVDSQDTSTSSLSLIQTPELNQGVVTKLQEMAKWLKENWYWIQEVGKALLFVFGTTAVAKLLLNIGKMLGIGSVGGGLIGLQNVLLGLAALYVISVAIEGAIEVINSVNELNKQLDENIELQKSLKKEQEKTTDGYLEMAKSGDLTAKQQETLKWYLDSTSESLVNQYRELEKSKNWVGEFTGANNKLSEQQRILIDRMNNIIQTYDSLYKQGNLNEEQTRQYISAINDQIRMMRTLGQDTSSLEYQYSQLTGKKWEIVVGAEITGAKKSLEELKAMVGAVIGNGTISFGGSSGGGFRGYATGGIVTQPTRALIGEAGYPEAVVPMTQDYLSTLASMIGQYSGNNGVSQVNVYLDGKLIQKQIYDREKQKNFATNG